MMNLLSAVKRHRREATMDRVRQGVDFASRFRPRADGDRRRGLALTPHHRRHRRGDPRPSQSYPLQQAKAVAEYANRALAAGENAYLTAINANPGLA